MVVEGNKCERGYEFAKHEMSNPSRTLTTTVRTKFPGVPVISVRTAGEIPRDRLMAAMNALSEVVVEEELGCGDTIMEDVAKTGVSVIVTSSALMQLGAELENKNAELNRRSSGGPSAAAVNPGSASAAGGGIGIVRNADVLDDLGADAAGGFVGAAGEAVGVEDLTDEESDVAQDGEGRIKQKGRPHIRK